MSHSIRRSSAAFRDLLESATYLAQQGPGLDDCFLTAVEETLNQIARLPEIGGSYETANPLLGRIRVWRVKGFEKYSVFYRTVENEIEVIRILHGARDIAVIFSEN